MKTLTNLLPHPDKLVNLVTISHCLSNLGRREEFADQLAESFGVELSMSNHVDGFWSGSA